MRTSKQTVTLFTVMAIIFVAVAWNESETKHTTKSTSAYDNIFSGNNMEFAGDYEMSAFNALAAEDDYFYSTPSNHPPPAEDVLVQRIPGDNYHILVMAVYSFNRYSKPTVQVPFNGAELTLKDDGTDYDKVAGDGVYTAKVFADVNEFKAQAIRMNAEDKKNKYNIQFTGRELKTRLSCDAPPFDVSALDKNQAVSIAAISGGSNALLDSLRANCIFITELSVVEDPARTWNPCSQTGNVNGPWTFKTLMKNLAKKTAGTDPTDAELSSFVLSFLNSWKTQKVINGDTVPLRSGISKKVINPWLNKSLAAGAPSGQLDMRFAPFKLTSIVNRFDIRERAAGIPAGEGRYTFCLIDSACTKALEMTIVIEYAIPKPDICDSLQNWATQWYNLKNFTLGSTQYLAALQAITDQYSLWGTGNRGNTNTNLDALRTNEREFAPNDGSPRRWEFREFGISATPRKIFQRKVAQIPQDKFNAKVDNPDVRSMTDWINANKDGINNDDYTVPDSTNGRAFLGGHAQILDTPIGIPVGPYHWNGVEPSGPAHINNTTTRHVFSRNTCTGCHAGEVQTFFTHVDPVFFGTQATLSGFLAGKAGRGGAVDFDNNPNNDSMMVKDAAGRGGANNSVRLFNDILRRAKDLKDFVTTPPCASLFALRNELMFQPVHAVH